MKSLTGTLQTTLAINSLLRLQKQLYSMRPDFSRSGGMPAPKGKVALPDQADPLKGQPPQTTVRLFENSLGYYPVELEGIRRGDLLRAFFQCALPNVKERIPVCFDLVELAQEERNLNHMKKDYVVTWNLLQVQAALQFMTILPPKGMSGVNEHVVTAFSQSPREFKPRLIDWSIAQL